MFQFFELQEYSYNILMEQQWSGNDLSEKPVSVRKDFYNLVYNWCENIYSQHE